MKKTRIQMYEKKTLTKSIQMYEKNTLTKNHKNMHIYWNGGQPITAPRKHGVQCLAQGHLSSDTRPGISRPNLFLRGEWGLNPQPSGYWATTLTTLKMYDKNTLTNV